MKNPAEETTVRPNQNQTKGNRHCSNAIFQLVPHEKEPRFSQYRNDRSRGVTIQPKPETGSPFFANNLVKIAITTPGRWQVVGKPIIR